MSDRKAELERKKAKLQALREEKDRRRREKEMKDMEETTGRAVGSGLLDKDTRRELDDMLSSLGVAPVSDVLSSLSSINSMTPEHSMNHTPDTSLQLANTPVSHLLNSSVSSRKREPKLCVVSIQTADIAPKTVETYTKQTQTLSSGHERDGYFEDWWRPRKAHATDYYDEYNLNPGLEWEDEFTVLTFDDPQAEDEEGSLPHLDGFQSKLPPGILPHGLPQVKEVQPAVTALEHESAAKQRRENEERSAREVRELSEEEKQMIMLSEEFRRFMDRAGRVVERALAEQVDVCADYTGGAGADGAEDGSDERSRAQRLSLNRCFSDERWSRNRCVTALDWSPQYPELLLASYHCNEEAPNEPDGVCLVWNSKFRKVTPEYVFHCQSAVTAAAFARFHPNLVVGGTYSGQIVLWDNRVQKRTPVQRTPLAATAHTHPVYCVCVVGTQNAHNLITVSTDGRMCSWSLDMLSQPQEKLELQRQQSKPVAATCLAFPRSDVNNFLVGSEEGAAYGACRHGARAGLTDTYEAHQGSVTAVSTNAVPGGIDFSHLFLTSSIDWTVKLWSVREPRPVHSFEHNADYVLDVAWSPVHPAMFAAVDGSGRLDLWNLNQDTEVPAAGVLVDGAPALNRVAWSPSGLQVAAGDDAGRVWIYDVAETFAHPRHDDWNRLMYTIQELRGAQADDDLDHRLGLVGGGFGSGDQRLAASPLRCV